MPLAIPTMVAAIAFVTMPRFSQCRGWSKADLGRKCPQWVESGHSRGLCDMNAAHSQTGASPMR
ncbi:MAG: hypothetical protein ACJ8ET_08775, partial [Sphingomicrobium sp.]